MRTGVVVHLSPTDRKRPPSIVDDRNGLQKHVWRARIVLATADGVGIVEIMRTAGVSKTAVWRWRARFMDEGVEGLLLTLAMAVRRSAPNVHSPESGQSSTPNRHRRRQSFRLSKSAARCIVLSVTHP